MLFEKRELNTLPNSASIDGLSQWNRRQSRRHQYTPSLTSLCAASSRSSNYKDGGSAATLSHDEQQQQRNNIADFIPTMNRNCPEYLPKSHRRLQWEKRMHTATVAPFVNKITAGPSPQEREQLQQLFAAGAASRREVSHAALHRSIGGHQRAI